MTGCRVTLSAWLALVFIAVAGQAEAQQAPQPSGPRYRNSGGVGDFSQPNSNLDAGIAPNYQTPRGTDGYGQVAQVAAGPNQNGLPAGQPPVGAPQPRNLTPPPPPFVLTPQQQDELEKVLAAWEQKSGQSKSFTCDFVRWEYDPVFFPQVPGQPEREKTRRAGEIKYRAPDKGLIHETSVLAWKQNQSTQKLEQAEIHGGDYWVCDGQNIYQVFEDKHEVHEIAIPPQLQGQAITQGPLPFVFSAKAADLQKRYYIRVITPPDVAKDEIWLEILPKYQRDAANFSQVKVILRASDMFPQAVQITDPNKQNRDVYQLTRRTSVLPDFGNFQPPSIGMKRIKDDMPGAASSGNAGGGAGPSGQAQIVTPNSRK